MRFTEELEFLNRYETPAAKRIKDYLINYSEMARRNRTLVRLLGKKKEIDRIKTIMEIKRGKSAEEFLENVIEATKIVSGVNPLTNSRKRMYVDLRHMIAHIARKYTDITTVKLGERFGKDHSSIIHSINVAENLLKSNESFYQRYYAIVQYLKDKDGYDL